MNESKARPLYDLQEKGVQILAIRSARSTSPQPEDRTAGWCVLVEAVRGRDPYRSFYKAKATR